MGRRTFLGGVGVGIGILAGCLSQAGPTETPTGDSTTTTTPPQPTEAKGNDRELVQTGETKRVTLGTGTLTHAGPRKPHAVVLTNSTQANRTGRLVVRRPDESVAHDQTYELEAEAAVTGSLTDPLEYSATVALAGTDVWETADVSLENYDCNSSSTRFDILAADRVEVETVSTLVLCTNLESEHVSAGDGHSRSLGDGSLPDDDRNHTTSGSRTQRTPNGPRD